MTHRDSSLVKQMNGNSYHFVFPLTEAQPTDETRREKIDTFTTSVRYLGMIFLLLFATCLETISRSFGFSFHMCISYNLSWTFVDEFQCKFSRLPSEISERKRKSENGKLFSLQLKSSLNANSISFYTAKHLRLKQSYQFTLIPFENPP